MEPSGSEPPKAWCASTHRGSPCGPMRRSACFPFPETEERTKSRRCSRTRPARSGSERSEGSFASPTAPLRATIERVPLDAPGLTGASTIFALAEDGKGNLWLGTESGLYRRSRGGKVERVADAGGLPTDVRCLFRDRSGVLWVGSHSEGLLAVRPDDVEAPSLRPVYRRASGLAGDFVTRLLETSDGKLWAACFGGVSEISPDRASIRTYTVAEGLSGLGMWSLGRRPQRKPLDRQRRRRRHAPRPRRFPPVRRARRPDEPSRGRALRESRRTAVRAHARPAARGHRRGRRFPGVLRRPPVPDATTPPSPRDVVRLGLGPAPLARPRGRLVGADVRRTLPLSGDALRPAGCNAGAAPIHAARRTVVGHDLPALRGQPGRPVDRPRRPDARAMGPQVGPDSVLLACRRNSVRVPDGIRRGRGRRGLDRLLRRRSRAPPRRPARALRREGRPAPGLDPRPPRRSGRPPLDRDEPRGPRAGGPDGGGRPAVSALRSGAGAFERKHVVHRRGPQRPHLRRHGTGARSHRSRQRQRPALLHRRRARARRRRDFAHGRAGRPLVRIGRRLVATDAGPGVPDASAADPHRGRRRQRPLRAAARDRRRSGAHRGAHRRAGVGRSAVRRAGLRAGRPAAIPVPRGRNRPRLERADRPALRRLRAPALGALPLPRPRRFGRRGRRILRGRRRLRRTRPRSGGGPRRSPARRCCSSPSPSGCTEAGSRTPSRSSAFEPAWRAICTTTWAPGFRRSRS